MIELNPAIFKHWVHSREEDTEEGSVYRPKDYKFPPARGRNGFEIKENGEFIKYEIGPDDRPRKISGHWKQEGDNRIRADFEDQRTDSTTLDILMLDDKILIVKKS